MDSDSSYEYKTGNGSNLYITVSRDAKPEMYHPMQEAEQLVIDAINVGLATLPTTADFITYESVYLPKKHFIKEEPLSTEDYLAYFYPFDKPDFRKNGVESGWTVTDRGGIAITMVMENAPQAVAMGLQKEYAERYDWLVKEFTD